MIESGILRTIAHVALLGVFALSGGSGVAAQVPPEVGYQGKLLDALGAPVADGAYDMEFRFYDACTDGNLLLTDTHPGVTTTNGLYAVTLGSGTLEAGVESDLAGVFGNHDVVCLGITVGTDAEMTPRQRLVSAPYALRAAVADVAATGGVEPGDDVTWEGDHTFEQNLTLTDGFALRWPHTTGNQPPDADFTITKFVADPAGQQFHPNGESDEQFMFCYNCFPGSAVPNDASQHMFNFKFEQTYFETDVEYQEHNWNLVDVRGFRWRPFGFRATLSGTCSNDGSVCYFDADCGGGTCDGLNRADFTWAAGPEGTCDSDIRIDCLEDADCPGGGSCSASRTFTLFSNGRIRSKQGFDVQGRITNQVGGAEGAIGIRVDVAPTNTDGVVRGVDSDVYFHEDAVDGSGLLSQIGIEGQAHFAGGASGRRIDRDLVGLQGFTFVEAAGGTGNTIERQSGLRVKSFFLGDAGTAVAESAGVRVATPQVTGSTVVDRHHAIWIENQQALGDNAGSALLIESQGAGAADRGNLRLAGGSATNGHLDIGGGHLWREGATGQLRYKDGVPVGDADGTPVHAPAGMSPSWGGTYWGDAQDADFDSGDEVCAAAGLDCLETYDMGDDAPTACSSNGHGTARFLALCY